MFFYIILLMVSFFISALMRRLIFNMLVHANAIRKNYRGEDIPVGMGIVFPVSAICSFVILNLFFPLGQMPYIFLFGIISMAFVGVIDDILGNRDTTGLKGHIGKLFRLELTTGGLKALMGGIIALMVYLPFEKNIALLFFNAIIIALFTNLINLLDLRPGRAIKVYLLLAMIISIFFYKDPNIYLLFMVTIPVITYFPMDLKAKAMMGDVGSNILGFTLGFFATQYLGNLYKVGLLIVLILIHVYAEKFSITKLIEKNRILGFLDGLGRR